MCARSGLRNVCPFRTRPVAVHNYAVDEALWRFRKTVCVPVWKDGLDRSGARSLFSVQRIELLRMTSYASCVKQPV
jgi:hypothetical protein